MRQFDKTLKLATNYRAWLQDLGDADHPEYTSSNGPHYRNIVANLLWLQGGVCAYTEECLIDPDKVAPEKWVEGVAPEFKADGDLDHYDPRRKKLRGWEWENFFMVGGDVNRKEKRDRPPHGLLKPDAPGYTADFYLEYDFAEHHFVPCRDREKDVRDKIREDIAILGLNREPVVFRRRNFLEPLISDIEYDQLTVHEARVRVKQFYTAFEMSVQSLGLGA